MSSKVAEGTIVLATTGDMEGTDEDDTFPGSGGNGKYDGKKNYEVIYGRECDDELEGGKGEDKIYGGGGIDQIEGNSKEDVLNRDPIYFYSSSIFLDFILLFIYSKEGSGARPTLTQWWDIRNRVIVKSYSGLLFAIPVLLACSNLSSLVLLLLLFTRDSIFLLSKLYCCSFNFPFAFAYSISSFISFSPFSLSFLDRRVSLHKCFTVSW
ncbi:MAG TPA: hypothetical protein VFR94_04270 [Nitrososphaeraceae archaeon]|nr:hypothetical protein [Nitrososphaeraceae archaeon]